MSVSCIDELLKTKNVHVYNKCLIGKKQTHVITEPTESCNMKDLLEVAKYSYNMDAICPIETPNLICKNNHWYCE